MDKLDPLTVINCLRFDLQSDHGVKAFQINTLSIPRLFTNIFINFIV